MFDTFSFNMVSISFFLGCAVTVVAKEYQIIVLIYKDKHLVLSQEICLGINILRFENSIFLKKRNGNSELKDIAICYDLIPFVYTIVPLAKSF